MKKIIFLEGDDGAGKTTLSLALQQTLLHDYFIDCVRINKNAPAYHAQMYNIKTKYNPSSSTLAKLSYKMARINLCLAIELFYSGKTVIFERGLIHNSKDCPELAEQFVNDICESYKDYGIIEILLHPPYDVIKKRIGKRLNASEDDKKTLQSSTQYYDLLNRFDNFNNPYVTKLVIDSSEDMKKNVNTIIDLLHS